MKLYYCPKTRATRPRWMLSASDDKKMFFIGLPWDLNLGLKKVPVMGRVDIRVELELIRGKSFGFQRISLSDDWIVLSQAC